MSAPISVTVGPEEDEQDGGKVMVAVTICSPDNVHYSASAMLDHTAGDIAIADAMVRCALSSAHARSSGLWLELQRVIAGYDGTSQPARGEH